MFDDDNNEAVVKYRRWTQILTASGLTMASYVFSIGCCFRPLLYIVNIKNFQEVSTDMHLMYKYTDQIHNSFKW